MTGYKTVTYLLSFCSILLFGIIVSNVNAQSLSQDYSEKELKKYGNRVFYDQNFRKALAFFKAYEEKAGALTPEYKYKIALCYLNTHIDKSKAVKYLEAIAPEDVNEQDYYYAMGRAYHFDYQLYKAISYYEKFLEGTNILETREKQVRRAIEMCKNAQKLLKEPIQAEIHNLGENVNTEYPEYVPVITSDENTLIFTSKRNTSKGGLQYRPGEPDKIYGTYFEDIFSTHRINDSTWTTATHTSDSINTLGHDAAVALSPGGDQLFIYRSDSQKYGNLFTCRKIGDTWSKPNKMPAPINSDYWEGSATITPDGKTLYFASNRPGGLGGKDLYKSTKKENGEWSEPVNLGPKINTQYDEDAPFIHPDLISLYFSSKGHNSMGGYDIFKSELTDTGWSPVLNIGSPINTTDNDMYFYISGNGKHAYYSSSKQDNYGGQDLYWALIPKKIRPHPLMLVKGKVTSIDTTIPKKLNVDLNLLGEADSTTRAQKHLILDYHSGEFILFLPYDQDYELKASASNHHTFHDSLSTHKHTRKPYQHIFLQPTDTVTTQIVRKDTVDQQIDTSEPRPPDETQAQKGETDQQEKAEEQLSKEEQEETKSQHAGKNQKENKKLFMVSYYQFNRAILTEQNRTKLAELAALLKKHPSIDIEIAGYTDAIGSKKYNLKLGKRRANSVYQFLLEHDISATRIESFWYGEQKAFATNRLPHGPDNPTGRSLNRRTEIMLIGDSATLQAISDQSFHKPELYQLKELANRKQTVKKVLFSVQITAYHDQLPEEYYQIFDVILEKPTLTGNLKRFLVGQFKTYTQASKCKKLLRKMGIEGAFVVSYVDDKRVPVKKAISLKQEEASTSAIN